MKQTLKAQEKHAIHINTNTNITFENYSRETYYKKKEKTQTIRGTNKYTNKNVFVDVTKDNGKHI